METASSVASRKRTGKHYSVEAETLDRITKESEARLAARRQARVEARQLRIREIEQQQQQQQQNATEDDHESHHTLSNGDDVRGSGRTGRMSSSASTRLTSGDTTVEESSTPTLTSTSGHTAVRELRHELMELEDKLRQTILSSAQLDNEKSTLTYQMELYKDQLSELYEEHRQLQRVHKSRCSEHEVLKRACGRLKSDLELCRKQLEERDQLIANHGLVMVGDDEYDSDSGATERRNQKALVSQSTAALLSSAGDGTLDCRLRRLAEEKNELEDQLNRLKLQLEEERHLSNNMRNSSSYDAGMSDTGGGDVGGVSSSESELNSAQLQREVSRQVADYRFKLQKSQQEICDLQTSIQRLDNQVLRYKSAAEIAEKAEEELKQERRKLQRELRESHSVIDELETSNAHLKKRLDKLKSARSNLLKDLSE